MVKTYWRLVVQTKAMVCATIFLYVEIKKSRPASGTSSSPYLKPANFSPLYESV